MMGAYIDGINCAEASFIGDYIIYWDYSKSSDHSHAMPDVSLGDITENRWYRVYKSGWCEQGGIDQSGYGKKTISFTIPFATPPIVFQNPITEGLPATETIKVNGASSIKVNTFDMAKTNNSGIWIAYGNILIP